MIEKVQISLGNGPIQILIISIVGSKIIATLPLNYKMYYFYLAIFIYIVSNTYMKDTERNELLGDWSK